MHGTTLRVALAQAKMNKADLRKATALDGSPPLSFDTINKVLDGIPEEGVSLLTLRRIERAVPNLRLVIGFEQKEN